jgi:hypothetical protein
MRYRRVLITPEMARDMLSENPDKIRAALKKLLKVDDAGLERLYAEGGGTITLQTFDGGEPIIFG